MSLIGYGDLSFLLAHVLFFVYIWLLFFKLNNYKVINEGSKCKISRKSKILNSSCFNYSYIYIMKLLFIHLIIFHGRNDVILFNHFNLNNFTLTNSTFFFFINYLIFVFLRASAKKYLVKSNDYYFSVNNILIITPFFFFANTVFSFLFILEVISTLTLYKLVSSKIWYTQLNGFKNKKVPQQYINMLFFQFWVTFFSTIFIVYFYVNVFFLFGSTEWFLIQFLDVSNDNFVHKVDNSLKNFLVLIFTFSVFFKLGVSPMHLFKLDVYKGIPYLSVFFYTVYFLTIFLYFTIILLTDLLVNFDSCIFTMLFIITVFGILYVIVLMFDVSFLKVFFAYSTIINTIGFFLITISLF